MHRAGFTVGAQHYRVNGTTLAYWPQTHIVFCAGVEPGPRLITAGPQFIAFARHLGCEVDADSPENEQCADCRRDLVDRGHFVWTIWDALERLSTAPEDEVTANLLACLENWFFVEKIDP